MSSACQMLEMVKGFSDFWSPLSEEDLKEPFVFSMMTVIDEPRHVNKYNRLELVEFYEFIGRVAIMYANYLKEEESEKSHGYVTEFRHLQV